MEFNITKEKKIWFSKIRNSKKLYEKNILIKEYCKNKDVLDIGCVGQDINYSSKNWIHNQVKEVAKSIVGVDINTEGIEDIKKKGYEVYHYNELLKIDRKFDILLILDVIEHVNDPVAFLNSYKNFVNKNGKIIITTPNSNRAINFVNIFFRNEYSMNYEHTFWFCPKTIMEVFNRVDGVKVNNFYWLKHYILLKNKNWKQKIIYKIDNFLVKLRSNFSPNFMFILEKK